MGILGTLQEKVKGRKKTEISKDSVFKILKDIRVAGQNRSLSQEELKTFSFDNGFLHAAVSLNQDLAGLKDAFRTEALKTLGSLPHLKGLQVTVTAKAAQAPKKAAKPRTGLDGVREIIAIASGKGGVGKSSCAVNLAYALKQTGAKVGILDADIYGPSLVRMTGVGEPKFIENEKLVPPQKDGIKIISAAMFNQERGAAVMRGPMVSQMIQQFLFAIDWGELDVLVIDFPPGTGDVQITLAQQARITGAVMVTTPQEVALLDARKAASMFTSVQIPIVGVVENMSYFDCGHGEKHFLFGKGGGASLAKELDVSLLGEIPFETTVPMMADSGKAMVKMLPDSECSKVYSRVAVQVAKFTADQKETKFKPFQFAWKEM